MHSLMLLGGVFNVSLDQLVKGDIEIMKKEIDKAEVAEFNRLGKIHSALFILNILAFIPLVVFLKKVGFYIWLVMRRHSRFRPTSSSEMNVHGSAPKNSEHTEGYRNTCPTTAVNQDRHPSWRNTEAMRCRRTHG